MLCLTLLLLSVVSGSPSTMLDVKTAIQPAILADEDVQEPEEARSTDWSQEKLMLPRFFIGGACSRLQRFYEIWTDYKPDILRNVTYQSRTLFVWNTPELLDEMSRGCPGGPFSPYGKSRCRLTDVEGVGLRAMLPTDSHWNPDCLMRKGSVFVPADEHMKDMFPGSFVVGDGKLPRMPHGSSVEVMRFWRKDQFRSDSDVATTAQVWYYHAPGSGIYLDMGRTLWAKPTSHLDISPFSCAQVRGRYDTIVFQRVQPKEIHAPASYGGLVELVDCRGRTSSEPQAASNSSTSAMELKEMRVFESSLVATTFDEAREGLKPKNRSVCYHSGEDGPPAEWKLSKADLQRCLNTAAWESACAPPSTSRFLSFRQHGEKRQCACDSRYTYLNCFGSGSGGAPQALAANLLALTSSPSTPRKRARHVWSFLQKLRR
jgi:hypothetical protein